MIYNDVLGGNIDMYIMVTFCPFKGVFYFYLWRHYNYFQCLFFSYWPARKHSAFKIESASGNSTYFHSCLSRLSFLKLWGLSGEKSIENSYSIILGNMPALFLLVPYNLWTLLLKNMEAYKEFIHFCLWAVTYFPGGTTQRTVAELPEGVGKTCSISSEDLSFLTSLPWLLLSFLTSLFLPSFSP